MPPKGDPVEDMIKALSDKRVKELLCGIFEDQLKSALSEIHELKRQNQEQTKQIEKLSTELYEAQAKIIDLESYSRRENLVITGLSLNSYAEASHAVTSTTDELSANEHSAVTEKAVLALCNNALGVNVTPADISVAHRIKKKAGQHTGPPAIIVRFMSRKVRDSVYAARKKLKNQTNQVVYINEDITKETAALFAKARKLVKQRVIASSWTSNGILYYKRSNDPSCRPTRVKSESDLP